MASRTGAGPAMAIRVMACTTSFMRTDDTRPEPSRLMYGEPDAVVTHPSLAGTRSGRLNVAGESPSSRHEPGGSPLALFIPSLSSASLLALPDFDRIQVFMGAIVAQGYRRPLTASLDSLVHSAQWLFGVSWPEFFRSRIV